MRCLTPHCRLKWIFLAILTTLVGSVSAQSVCPAHRISTDPVSVQASNILQGLLQKPSEIAAFYKTCDFTLAWSRDGQLTDQGRMMIHLLDHADEKGLRPDDYGSPMWGTRACALDIRCDDSAHDLALFDLDLTRAAMRYVGDLLYGRANPREQRAIFDVHPDPLHVASVIWSSIIDAQDVISAVQHLEPDAPGYLRAEAAVTQYLKLQQLGPDIHVPINLADPGTNAPWRDVFSSLATYPSLLIPRTRRRIEWQPRSSNSKAGMGWQRPAFSTDPQ